MATDMPALFLAITGAPIVGAFVTGKAYYGSPALYIERRKNPISFWLLLLAEMSVWVEVLSYLIGNISN